MGKDTGGNRKQGRAGAPQPPAQTPAVGVAPVTKVLTPKEAGKFTRDFAQQRYGTTKPAELESEWGVKLDVDKTGIVSVTATTPFAGGVDSLLSGTKASVVNYAKSNGFLAEVIGESTQGKTVNAKFRVWGP